MSVIRCMLLRGGTRLELDEFGRATVTRVYIVETNSAADGEYTVAIQSTSALPDPIPHLIVNVLDNPYLAQYNLDHGAGEISGTTDTCAWLTKKLIEPVVGDESSPYYWKVTCTWTPLPLGYAGGTGTGGSGPVLPRYNPLNDPVTERSEYEHYRRKTEFDINGSAMANSAGDLFNDIIIDDLRPVLVFTKNMWPASAIDNLAAQYKNAINTDTFRGHAPYTLKIASITKGPLQERHGNQFMPAVFKMHKAEVSSGAYGTDQTWVVAKADVGVHELLITGTGTGAVATRIPTKVRSGSSYGEFLDFVNLAPDGTRLPDGTPPNKKTFYVYPQLPFSGLGLT